MIQIFFLRNYRTVLVVTNSTPNFVNLNNKNVGSKAYVTKNKSSQQGNVMRDMAPYLSLGAQMSGAIVVSGAIGWWIDSQFQTAPVFLIIMLLFGIISGMTMFIRAALGADKKVT